MTEDQENEVREIVEHSLGNAERVYGKIGALIKANFSKAPEVLMESALETQIPGCPIIQNDKPLVDSFIAMMVDLVNTTEKFRTVISAEVNKLQRVYYETSAVLPAVARLISYEQGSVTEYLGDGVLGLFRTSAETLTTETLAARTVAKNCFLAMDKIVNPILAARYHLPALKIKIGMSYSQAIITAVGIVDGYMVPKAIGECVYLAQKHAAEGPLHMGYDKIYISKAMYDAIPTAKDGGGFKCGKIKTTEGDAYWIE